MLVDTKQALRAGAMSVFTDLLNHSSPEIKSKAARDIFDLRFSYKYQLFFKAIFLNILILFNVISIPLEGKQEALTLETVPLLAALLDHEHVEVRSKAALGLGA